MAVGNRIVSVFCGAADKDAYEQVSPVSKAYTPTSGYSDSTQQLHRLYATVRWVRESDRDYDMLLQVWSTIQQDHSYDWLCALELLEVLKHHGHAPEVAAEIQSWLLLKSESQPELRKLIGDGLALIEQPGFDLVI